MSESDTVELPTISTTAYSPLQHTFDGDGNKNSKSNVIATDDDDGSDGEIRSEAHRLIDIIDQHAGINNNKIPLSIFRRAKLELSWNYPHFSLLENYDEEHDDDDDGSDCVVLIDAQKSFAPASPRALLFRCVWLVVSLLLEFNSFKLRNFNYLTILTISMTILYQLMTCGMSLYAADFISGVMERRRRLFGDDQQQQAGTVVRFVWIIYTVALVTEFVVVFGYWTFLYHGGGLGGFHNLYRHLFIGFILLFDGTVIGRIPLRLKHLRWFYVYIGLYLLWTIIFAHWNLGKNHDGIIYHVVDWKHNPKLAIIVVTLLGFVAGPLSFFFCWLCSLWSKGCTFDGGRRFHKEVYILDASTSIDEEVVLFDDNIFLPEMST